MSWTMIIMLAGGYNMTSPAITNVPGFISAAACAEAGNRVIKNNMHMNISVICVEVHD